MNAAPYASVEAPLGRLGLVARGPAWRSRWHLLDEAYLVSPDARAVLAPGITGILSLEVGF